MIVENNSTIKEIDTPIGKGTIVGITPEGDAICVMHTRPKEERDRIHGATYVKWWEWDGEKITGELSK